MFRNVEYNLKKHYTPNKVIPTKKSYNKIHKIIIRHPNSFKFFFN